MKRESKTEKLLSILDALSSDISIFFDRRELSRIVYKEWDRKTNLSKALSNLKRYGYLEIVEKDNRRAIRLTQKGKIKIWQPKMRQKTDVRWRLVAFDIEEKRKSTRNIFRNYLKILGFKPMQKSLWISPYDVVKDLEEIINILDIRNNVDYFIADAITDKQSYENLFNL